MSAQSEARLMDDAVDAYVAWREECTSLRNAYEWWTVASTPDARSAFAAYRAAVDREERAADVYADRMTRLGALLTGSPARL